MSGFDSAFHEPLRLTSTGVVNDFRVGPSSSLPGANIPYSYIGPDARPCGGIGGYYAAANEAKRLQDAAWDSVPTHNIHEPYKLLDTSASLPDINPMRAIMAKIMREQDEAMRQGIESARSSASMPDTNPMRAIMARVYERQEVARKLQVQQKMTRQYLESGEDIGVAQIQHQRGSLTVYEQTGYSHISHVAGEGYHLTTQVPGIGRDEGLDEGLSFHTYVKPNRSGRLKFDSE